MSEALIHRGQVMLGYRLMFTTSPSRLNSHSSFVLLIIMFTVMQEYWWLLEEIRAHWYLGFNLFWMHDYLSCAKSMEKLEWSHLSMGCAVLFLKVFFFPQLICLYFNHDLCVQTVSTLPPLVQLSQLFPPLHRGSPSSPPFCNYLHLWASTHLSTLCCRHLIWPLGIRSLTWDLGLHDPFTALKLSHQMCLAEKGFGVLIRARRGHVA